MPSGPIRCSSVPHLSHPVRQLFRTIIASFHRVTRTTHFYLERESLRNFTGARQGFRGFVVLNECLSPHGSGHMFTCGGLKCHDIRSSERWPPYFRVRVTMRRKFKAQACACSRVTPPQTFQALHMGRKVTNCSHSDRYRTVQVLTNVAYSLA